MSADVKADITSPVFARAGVDNEKDEKARRAVKAFRAMQPMLSAYARVISGHKDARVEMAARDNGSTDGRRIFFRPPLALGDSRPHIRKLCDKRDEYLQQRCPACLVREEVMVTIIHEIAHIAEDSFEETDEAAKKKMVEAALKESKSEYADKVRAKLKSLPSYKTKDYINLASCINEFLPIIWNALEDARVNKNTFKARKGTKVMFDADAWRVFTKGVEQKDPSGEIVVKLWTEYPLNMQVIVGIFCKVTGYDYSNWFVPPVVKALDDPELTAILRKMDTVRNASGVYYLSFPVLERLRELGFCGTPQDPDEPEPEPNQDNEEEEQPGGGESDEPEDGDDSGSASDSSGEGADGAGDDSESQEGSDSGNNQGEADEASEGEPGPTDSDDGVGGPEGEPSERDDDETTAEGDDTSGDPAAGDSDTSDEAGSPEEGAVDEDSGSDSGSEGTPSDEEGSDGGAGAADDSEERESARNGESDSDEPAPGDQDDSASSDGGESGAEAADDSSDEAGDESSEGSSAGTPGEGSEPADEESPSPQAGGSDSQPASEDVDSEGEEGEGDDDGSAGHEGTGDIDSSTEPGQAEQPRDEPASDAPGTGEDGSQVDTKPEAEPEEATKPEPAGDEPDTEGKEGDTIDSGADDGQGGTQVIEDESYDHLGMGSPEETKLALQKWGDHEEKPKTIEEKSSDNAIDRAIIQGIYFETPSRNIWGVREHRYGDPHYSDGINMSQAWEHGHLGNMGYTRWSLGISGDFDAPESILGPALMRMRVAFSDNKRGHEARHRKSGKVDGRVLGKRASLGDERLFKKRTLPGKKDYFVLIGMDVSGSTVGTNIQLEKKAVKAQADLCDRMGVAFAIFAHSGNFHKPAAGRAFGIDLDIYMVKEPHEVWDSKVKERLTELGPDAANLDGHTLEYYRKILDGRHETDRIIMYYTDGKMPAENESEELEILQREIRTCKQKGYTLMGVGIRTDSPIRHGLDTVQVDTDEDIVRVVKHLEKRLVSTAGRR